MTLVTAIILFGLLACAFNVWVAWLYQREIDRTEELSAQLRAALGNTAG